MRLNGSDAKWLVAGVDLERQRLVYSTSELQTTLRQRTGDVALFYGRTGEAGETVLRYTSAPSVRVLAGDVASSFDAARGDLKLTYTHGALARVRIEGGGRPPLLLLIGDEGEGVPSGGGTSVLVRGPAMLRSARLTGDALALTGDTVGASDFELWAAADVKRLRWNGQPLARSSHHERRPDRARRVARTDPLRAARSHQPDMACVGRVARSATR